MSERTPIVAANWKMHKTATETTEFCDELLPRVEGLATEIVICPPFLALPAVVEATKGGPVQVAAQNMHYEQSGAYTGEVSPAMLLDAGATAVVLGHSERRQLFGETDEALSRKVPAALEAGLTPILCVGETEDERERDETDRILRRQIDAGLSRVERGRLADVVIAYEPIWAIGTGLIASRDEAAGAGVRIQYGGSVKPANAADLLGREEIDGALVGGASLDPSDFAEIAAAAG
jgi:triosephosphate isomerase